MNPQIKVVVAIIVGSFLTDSGSANSPGAISRPAQDATSLVESASKGDLRAVQSIIAAGVDPNAKSRNGETALAAAAYKGSYDVVEFLLNNGAKVDQLSLGHCAIWVDIGFGFHQNPMPSYSFRCGNSIGPMSEEYAKADKLGVTPLLVAANSGHPKIVERLLGNGADIKARTFAGATALMLSTIANDIESMKILLANGADVNATAKKGQSALMLASWSDGRSLGARRMDAIRLLTDLGANINTQDEAGRSALMGAAEADNLEAAKLLLDKGAEVNAKSKEGRTALIKATDAGNVEMMRLLITRGADVNAKDIDGTTALSEAAFLHRKPEAVTVLLQSGARIDEKRNGGVGTALLVAELAGRDDNSRLLRLAGATLRYDEALILAASRGDAEGVKNLLKQGANANALGFGGKPVLMYAATVDNPAVVSLLIGNGADVNAGSDIGETALMVASFEGSTQVARLLVEYGAEVNATSHVEMTALINAAWRGRLEIVKFLIEKGADVNVRSKSGETALEMSKYGGKSHVAIAQVLTDAGAHK